MAHVMGASMGARFIVFNQLKYLRDLGYEVHQICSPGPWLEDLREAGINVTTIPISRRISHPADLLTVYRLYRHFSDAQYDIVHVHTAKAGFVGRLAARLAGVPIVVWTNAGFIFHEHTGALKRRAFVHLERMAARWCDVILSQNQEDVKTAVEEGICAPEKIAWLGNGIDLGRFDPSQVDADAVACLRAELSIPATHQVVGMVGRLVREKGFLEFFEAASAIREQHGRVKFLVVGPHEPEKPDAVGPELIHGTDLEEDIIFLTGMRMDIVDLLSLMDIVVLPSHREGLPRIPMEAGALRKPAIVTDIRGCREIVVDRETGLLVPVKDSGALAAAMLELLDDERLAADYGEAAYRRVREHFDERRVFERISSHYERLLEAKSLEV